MWHTARVSQGVQPLVRSVTLLRNPSLIQYHQQEGGKTVVHVESINVGFSDLANARDNVFVQRKELTQKANQVFPPIHPVRFHSIMLDVSIRCTVSTKTFISHGVEILATSTALQLKNFQFS